jgi:hypothetical protein
MCLPFLNLSVRYDALQYMSSNLLRGWCVAYIGDVSYKLKMKPEVPGMWSSRAVSALWPYLIRKRTALWGLTATEFPAARPRPRTRRRAMGRGRRTSTCPVVSVPPSVPIPISAGRSRPLARLPLFELSSPSLHFLLFLLFLQDKSPCSSTDTHYWWWPPPTQPGKASSLQYKIAPLCTNEDLMLAKHCTQNYKSSGPYCTIS